MDMFTYLNYYKDSSFLDIKFNEIDALILSCIAYMPNIKFDGDITFKQLYKKLLDTNFETHGTLETKTIELVEIMMESIRYKDILLSNLVKEVDDKTQFGALTFRSKYFTFIGYEGTNSSMIGWVENFMISLKYPTITQELAIKYLNSTLKLSDKNIYLGGHSKGGNLAISAAYSSSSRIFNKINKIFNFDGPGLRMNELNSKRFIDLNKKCINILPTGSVVGIMLFNNNYHFVEAEGTGFLQHNPYKWNIYGQFFVKGEQSKTSSNLQTKINESISSINPDDSIILLNRINKYFIDNNIKYISDFKEMKYNDLMKMINEYKDIDISIKEVFMEIFRVFFGNNK